MQEILTVFMKPFIDNTNGGINFILLIFSCPFTPFQFENFVMGRNLQKIENNVKQQFYILFYISDRLFMVVIRSIFDTRYLAVQ